MPQKRAQPKSRNAIVVLGMHRSGTSALGGVLARLGCEAPETLMPSNEFNPAGYYESIKIYEMNNAVLASGGSHWDDWGEFNPNWIETPRADEFLERGQDVLEAEFGRSRMFMIKDPRICRLMPLWSKLFDLEDITPVYVHTHRNPMDVARSLERREGWPRAYGILLWLRHVLDAEWGSRGAMRCFTSYDRLMDNWRGFVTDFESRTKLTFPRVSETVSAEIEAFLTKDLNNGSGSIKDLATDPLASKWAREVFDILERWAETGEEKADYARFDAVRAELNDAGPIFGKLVLDARELNVRKKEVQASAEKIVELQTSVDGYARQGKKLLSLKEEAQSDRNAAQARSEMFNKELQAARADVEQLHQELSERRAAQDALSERRIELERENAELSARLNDSVKTIATLEEVRAKLESEKWEIQSALSQRSLEAEEVGKLNAANAEKAATLAEQLDAVQKQRLKLEMERDALKTSARLIRANSQKDLELELRTALRRSRKKTAKEIESLTTALHQVRQNEAKQHEHMAYLEAVNASVLNSTSWKITSPLRRFIGLFKRR